MTALNTITNPFRNAIVNDPWEWNTVNVPEIHHEAFDLCRRALAQVRADGRSASVLLYGEAGSGKTHLLARVQALVASAPDPHDTAPSAVFVSVQLQTSPQMLWRHLRKRFAEDLLRPTLGERTQLERILLPRLAATQEKIWQAMGTTPANPAAWLEELRNAENVARAEALMDDALDLLDRQARVHDRNLLIAVRHLMLNHHRRDAQAWLRGESLPEVALEKLGLSQEQDEEPEERARRTVISVCRLLGEGTPIVFCFDQVEALQTHPQDLAGLHSFGQMASFLRDATRGALLISCMLTTSLNTLDEAVIVSDRQRLATAGERALSTLTPVEARKLVELRLNASNELRRMRPARHDGLWPLSDGDVAAALRAKQDTPRRLLSFCAERFDQLAQQGATPPKPSDQEFLAQEIETRLERAAIEATPEKTDEVVAHGLPLLVNLVDARWRQQTDARIRDAELVFASAKDTGQPGRIVISLCNQRSMRSLAGRLRRLREQTPEQNPMASPRERFILLRDARLPLGASAKQTRGYRDELLARGCSWVNVSPEMTAALDALRGLLSDAKAGDLANGGASLTPATVQEWLLTNLDTKLSPLRDLLDAITPSNPIAPDEDDLHLAEDLSEQLSNHFLLSATDLACKLERSEAEIEACARRHPDRFGLLNGPPLVLLQPTQAAPLDAEAGEPGVRGIANGGRRAGLTLSVSDVRRAILHATQYAPGEGAASTAQLGQIFHELFAALVGAQPKLNLHAALHEAEPDEEEWRRALTQHTYQQLFGPRLMQQQAVLHHVSDQTLTCWDAVQELCAWLSGLFWQLRQRGARYTARELVRVEQTLVWELREPHWTETVTLTGVADAVWQIPGAGRWCVVELKTGRTAPEADLAQACLYHQMLTHSGTPAGALALISFEPRRRERLFTTEELGAAQTRLKALIGNLAGVVKQNGLHGKAPDVPAKPIVTPAAHRQAEYKDLGEQLVAALREYGAEVELAHAPTVGPAFLRFPLTLGRRVRLNQVNRLAEEVQVRLALAAPPFIGLEAGRVVIDLQRPDRQTVTFAQVREQLPAPDALLGVAQAPIGVDIAGRLKLIDFAQPEAAHLLVAGTTGSGKSEWLRAAIAGLMLTNTPETLRLLLIDPKRNAFHALRSSDFLLEPLVFPGEQSAAEVLNRLVAEMERRYELIGAHGDKDLAEYVRRTGAPLPRIFCVCDEYADLISGDRKTRQSIEQLIVRLGQKARAAGIHLLLATQHPSREIIRGVLDSNLPARVGLKMQSRIESNMLLKSPGAEALLGRGDLLFKDIGAPVRLQGVYLAPDEARAIFEP